MSSTAVECAQARARIDDAIRQVWLACRDASEVDVGMLTDQDMKLWEIVTAHPAIQDRLNALCGRPFAVEKTSEKQ